MRKLLLVIDMQNDFIDGALGTNEAKEIVPKVCRKIEGWTGDIIMTRDTHGRDYLNTAEGKMLPVPHCIEKSEGWQINEMVRTAYERKRISRSGQFLLIFDKTAFGSMKVAEVVGAMKYDRIVLCGLCTDICVLCNAILCRTVCPEATIEVDASCCAGVCRHSYETALEAMAPCNIKITDGTVEASK